MRSWYAKNVLALISFFIVYFAVWMYACMCALFHYDAPMFQAMYSLSAATVHFFYIFWFSCFNFLSNCLCNFHYRLCTHADTHTHSNKMFNLLHAAHIRSPHIHSYELTLTNFLKNWKIKGNKISRAKIEAKIRRSLPILSWKLFFHLAVCVLSTRSLSVTRILFSSFTLLHP